MVKPRRTAGFAAAFGIACLLSVNPARAEAGETGKGLPDTTFMSGSLRIMSWKSPAMIIIPVADTLVFLYNSHNGATVDSVARKNDLRCLVNGSFFSGVRGDAYHAGLLARYGRLVSPALADRQLTHVVRINSTAHTVTFLPAQSIVPSSDPHVVEFQTGPLVIEGGEVRKDLIRSSINGLTAHTRTLLATLDGRHCFFVTVTEKVALIDLAVLLARLDVFQGGRLDVINLDGGSSVALYLRDAPGWSYNAGDRLPILIGFR
ncbi:MAG TPA: phosphodiester glycosidase family protein [Bacteroidota bacterium]